MVLPRFNGFRSERLDYEYLMTLVGDECLRELTWLIEPRSKADTQGYINMCIFLYESES